MPIPIFTNEEKFLIQALKTAKPSLLSNMFMWTCLLVGGSLAGIAMYCESVLLLFSAFSAFAILRLYEEQHHLKMLPLWRSIIEKYEAACCDE